MKASEIERSFSAGECVVEAGSSARELYIVRSGEVQLDGDPHVLCEGELFGEVAAILGIPHPVEARALSDVTVLVIDLPLLNRLCREQPEFSIRLIQHLARGQMRPQPSKPVSAAAGPLPRMASVALQRMVESGDGVGLARISGALRSLASDARMPMIEAYRCVQELLNLRLLRLSDNQLTVLNVDALRDLVQAEGGTPDPETAPDVD